MADIFVSYSTADRSQVSVLAEELQQRGWSVWWDREIVVGTAWDDAIEQEIAKARCVLVLWSPNSVKSEWVKNEARDAKQRHILVPALIAPTKFPIEFRHIQTADLTSWTPGEPNPEFEKLLAGLHQLLDGLKKPEISEGDKPTQTMVKSKFLLVFRRKRKPVRSQSRDVSDPGEHRGAPYVGPE